MLTITIDWLAVTFKEKTDEAQAFLDKYARNPTVAHAPARNGYTYATLDSNGVGVLWNPDYTGMGYHAVFSGTSLRNLFTSGLVQPHALLRACLDAGGSVSRLDLAKDFTEGQTDYEAVYKSLEQGLGGGQSRKISKMQNSEGGYTIYVGSRQSERFLRLYDKAAEQNIPGALWARLEVETKGMVARAVTTSIVNTGDFAGVFDNVVLGMVGDAKTAKLAQFFTPGQVPIGLPKIEKQTDREKWIADQVITAVARHYIDNPESEAVKRLINVLEGIDRQRKV